MAEFAACERYLSNLPKSVHVLDVAAGHGFFSHALHQSGVFDSFHATWVDRLPQSMDEGIHLVDFGAQVRRVPADLTKTNWSRALRDRAYHCALMGVVHHYLEPDKYAEVIHTIVSLKLKPGGVLAIAELCGGLFPDYPWQEAASTIVETLRATGAKDIAIITAPVRVGSLRETFTYRFVTAAVEATP
jgi:2-polyprenyl-3-methyl-5-hydroxy-6-metoxy-1,4-benzoquinol methylase